MHRKTESPQDAQLKILKEVYRDYFNSLGYLSDIKLNTETLGGMGADVILGGDAQTMIVKGIDALEKVDDFLTEEKQSRMQTMLYRYLDRAKKQARDQCTATLDEIERERVQAHKYLQVNENHAPDAQIRTGVENTQKWLEFMPSLKQQATDLYDQQNKFLADAKEYVSKPPIYAISYSVAEKIKEKMSLYKEHILEELRKEILKEYNKRGSDGTVQRRDGGNDLGIKNGIIGWSMGEYNFYPNNLDNIVKSITNDLKNNSSGKPNYEERIKSAIEKNEKLSFLSNSAKALLIKYCLIDVLLNNSIYHPGADKFDDVQKRMLSLKADYESVKPGIERNRSLLGKITFHKSHGEETIKETDELWLAHSSFSVPPRSPSPGKK